MNRTIKRKDKCGDIDIYDSDISEIIDLFEYQYNKNKNEIMNTEFKNEIDAIFSELKQEELPQEAIIILDSSIFKKIVTILLYDKVKYGGSPDELIESIKDQKTKKTLYMYLDEKTLFVRTILMLFFSIIVTIIGLKMIDDFNYYITVDLKLTNFKWGEILKTKSQSTYLNYFIVNFYMIGSKLASNLYKDNEDQILELIEKVISKLKTNCLTDVGSIMGENTYLSSTANMIEAFLNPNVGNCGLRILNLQKDDLLFKMTHTCSNLYRGIIFVSLGTSLAVVCVRTIKTIIQNIKKNKQIKNNTRKKTIKSGGSKQK